MPLENHEFFNKKEDTIGKQNNGDVQPLKSPIEKQEIRYQPKINSHLINIKGTVFSVLLALSPLCSDPAYSAEIDRGEISKDLETLNPGMTDEFIESVKVRKAYKEQIKGMTPEEIQAVIIEDLKQVDIRTIRKKISNRYPGIHTEIPKDFDPVKVYEKFSKAIYDAFVSIDAQADFPKYIAEFGELSPEGKIAVLHIFDKGVNMSTLSKDDKDYLAYLLDEFFLNTKYYQHYIVEYTPVREGILDSFAVGDAEDMFDISPSMKQYITPKFLEYLVELEVAKHQVSKDRLKETEEMLRKTNILLGLSK